MLLFSTAWTSVPHTEYLFITHLQKEGEDDQGHLKALSPEQLQSMAAKSWNLAVKLNSAHEEIATLQSALTSAIKQTSAMGTAINPEVPPALAF